MNYVRRDTPNFLDIVGHLGHNPAVNVQNTYTRCLYMTPKPRRTLSTLVVSHPKTWRDPRKRQYHRTDPHCKGVNHMYRVVSQRGPGRTLEEFATSIQIPYNTLRQAVAKWPIGRYSEPFAAVVASLVERARPTLPARDARRVHALARFHSRNIRGAIDHGTAESGIQVTE